MSIKKNNFVEIDYTAYIRNDNILFDTTIKDVAEKNKIFNPDTIYSPVTICVGENQVIKGLDEALVGKDIGSFEAEIDYENGFGPKNPKLITVVSLSAFNKEKIKPFPGMEVNIDGMYGIVKTVSSGRVIVDFNHPLSGKNLLYKVDVKKIINNDSDKIKSYLDIELNFPKKDIEVELDEKEKKAKVVLKKDQSLKETNILDKNIEQIKSKIKSLIGVDIEISEEVKKDIKEKKQD